MHSTIHNISEANARHATTCPRATPAVAMSIYGQVDEGGLSAVRNYTSRLRSTAHPYRRRQRQRRRLTKVDKSTLSGQPATAGRRGFEAHALNKNPMCVLFTPARRLRAEGREPTRQAHRRAEEAGRHRRRVSSLSLAFPVPATLPREDFHVSSVSFSRACHAQLSPVRLPRAGCCSCSRSVITPPVTAPHRRGSNSRRQRWTASGREATALARAVRRSAYSAYAHIRHPNPSIYPLFCVDL